MTEGYYRSKGYGYGSGRENGLYKYLAGSAGEVEESKLGKILDQLKKDPSPDFKKYASMIMEQCEPNQREGLLRAMKEKYEENSP